MVVEGSRERGITDHGHLKVLLSNSWLVAAGLSCAILSANAQVNVTQYHNNPSRDGLYIDSAFTQSAAANLTRDMNFDGTIVGDVYAQPLYIEGGPSGPMLIVVTESNNVYALDAVDGTIIWQRNVGPPVPLADLGCPAKFDPMGIIGTPVVDLASRALFFDAMVTPDGGTTIKHYIISLNVDSGAINSGWPVDVETTATYNGVSFTAEMQQQRPALGIVNGILYVGYGSMRDCTPYRGWLVGVPIDNPDPSSAVTAWAAATAAGTEGGAIWGVGGIASDGNNPFVTTGNTFNTGGTWRGGEAAIRFQPGPIFTGQPSDYWAPAQLVSDSTMATKIWVAPVHYWWMCRTQRPSIWWLQWAKMALPICLIAVTSVASLRRWSPPILPIKASPRRGPPTGLTKARMLLVALAKLSS